MAEAQSHLGGESDDEYDEDALFERRIRLLQDVLGLARGDIADAEECAEDLSEDFEKGHMTQEDFAACMQDLLNQLNQDYGLDGQRFVVVGEWRQIVTDDKPGGATEVRSVPTCGTYVCNGFSMAISNEGKVEFGLSFVVGSQEVLTTYSRGILKVLAFAKLDEIYIISAD